jgi:hypothetical protein
MRLVLEGTSDEIVATLRCLLDADSEMEEESSLAPTEQQLDDYVSDIVESVRQIRSRGGEVIVMEVVDGAIEVFDNVDVKRVQRSPADPPVRSSPLPASSTPEVLWPSSLD